MIRYELARVALEIELQELCTSLPAVHLFRRRIEEQKLGEVSWALIFKSFKLETYR